MECKYSYTYPSPLGEIWISADEQGVTSVDFSDRKSPGAQVRETTLIREAARQLEEYLAGHRRVFDFPLSERGTPFQKTVWRALRDIPYGQTRTYGQIAAAAGNPKASRAVGMANNRNPLAIVSPCHRVIGADGRMVGYGGGVDKKEFLLGLEKSNM